MTPRFELKRPIISFDVESTGLELTSDRIVSLAAIKFTPNGAEEPIVDQRKWLINPGFEMSEEVIAVHGITNDMVKDCQMFEAQAFEIFDFFNGCDVMGFNCARFDCPMLHQEFARAEFDWDWRNISIVDVGAIWQGIDRRTLEAGVVKFCGREHIGAHDAMNDALETVSVLGGMREWYDELAPLTVEDLAKKSFRDGEKPIDIAGKFYEDKDGQPRYAFGKHKGKLVKLDIELSDYGRSFCHWILRADFTADTRRVANEMIERFTPKSEREEQEEPLFGGRE